MENWSLGDDPLSPHWHSTDCQLTRCTDNSNEPFNTPFAHQRTQANLASTPTNTASTPLNAENFQNTKAANTLPTSEPLAHMFPCSNPVNPHMRSKTAGLQTFRDRADKWPAHRIAATPEQMSQAGLSNAGTAIEDYRIGCDLTIHGSNMPNGFQIVNTFNRKDLSLLNALPTYFQTLTARQSQIWQIILSQIHPKLLPESGFYQLQTKPRKLLIPDNNKKNWTKELEEMHSSSLTVEATTMGFSEKEIREAFLKQIAEHEATFANFATFIDTILTLQLTNSPILTSTPESQHNDRLSTSTETGMSSNIPPHKSTIQELHEQKQMSLCK